VSTLRISGLVASVAERQILNGIDLEVRSGEVHAVMGPNGSGKSTLSHVIMGKPGYVDVAGSVTVDDEELLGRPTFERAQAGLYLAMQYPIEVPGVSVESVLRESMVAAGRDGGADVREHASREAERIGFDERFLDRPLNVDLSGGEKKRNETMMMGVLRPKFAILDEIDSGLDVDALRAVSRRVQAATEEDGLGVLAITHYNRLLAELHPDVVHILVNGRIVDSGGPELAEELERSGYARYGADDSADSDALPRVPRHHERPSIIDPWGGDPIGKSGGNLSSNAGGDLVDKSGGNPSSNAGGNPSSKSGGETAE
jgi:Fe-S cluster assembly ATP-binding protein